MELFRVPLAGPSSAGVKLSGPLLAADADVLPDLAISPDSRWAMYRAEADSRGVEELYASELTSPPVFGWTDDFCASSLEGGWSWISEDASHWSLTARSCFLRILLQQGGLYGEGSTARNVLVRDAPEGDFTIEGHLLFEPAESFQHAGLLVYRNEDDFLGLTRGYCGFAHQNCLGDATDFTYEDMVHGGSNSYPVPAALANEVYLRITRRSGVYTGYVSEDGVFWREAGALEAFGGANPGQIGLFTGTGSRDAAEIPADYAYFRIGGDRQQVYLPLAVKGR
jgi:beta-xylosidase